MTSTLSLQLKNTVTHTNTTKNTSTFVEFLRHGKYPTMGELANFKFTDVVFSDGTQLKDVTFAQLAEAIWSLTAKN